MSRTEKRGTHTPMLIRHNNESPLEMGRRIIAEHSVDGKLVEKQDDEFCYTCALCSVFVAEIERLREFEGWVMGADHQSGCPGDFGYHCKCGLRELMEVRR